MHSPSNPTAWLTAAIEAGGGTGVYPLSKGELRKAIADGRALILEVPAGARIIAEANKLWHCVRGVGVSSDDDAANTWQCV